MKKYSILIAHQSTIPHYRIPFYNALRELIPENWQFDVVFDFAEAKKKRFFKEELDLSKVNFSILDSKTFFMTYGKTYIAFQDFIFKISKYDLIIVEQAFNNLSYPITQLSKIFGKKVALWGHGRHMSAVNPSLKKRFSEWLKSKFLNLSDGFFGYTEETKQFLESRNYPREKIFVLNNTINITDQRLFYDRFISDRQNLKKDLGLADKNVLLIVGRLTHTKRLDFLVDAMNYLFDQTDNYHLLVVGAGDTSSFEKINDQSKIRLFGSITNPEDLAPILCASDLFVFPGQVGLGPLQAMCYDLPILTIDSPKHMPEYVYLNDNNSIIMNESTSPEEYGQKIKELFDEQIPEKIRTTVWSTISQYTIDQMARNMISGIEKMLKK